MKTAASCALSDSKMTLPALPARLSPVWEALRERVLLPQ